MCGAEAGGGWVGRGRRGRGKEGRGGLRDGERQRGNSN